MHYDVKHTNIEMSYDDAVKKIPKGYEMIDLITFAIITQEVGISKLNFWFWIKNHKWNKDCWRTIARGYDVDYDYNLLANVNNGISRGVYIKVVND